MLQTGMVPVSLKVPKIEAKDGKTATFRSALIPPYMRKTRSLSAALPWLYLKGVSTGEMGAALIVQPVVISACVDDAEAVTGNPLWVPCSGVPELGDTLFLISDFADQLWDLSQDSGLLAMQAKASLHRRGLVWKTSGHNASMIAPLNRPKQCTG